MTGKWTSDNDASNCHVETRTRERIVKNTIACTYTRLPHKPTDETAQLPPRLQRFDSVPLDVACAVLSLAWVSCRRATPVACYSPVSNWVASRMRATAELGDAVLSWFDRWSIRVVGKELTASNCFVVGMIARQLRGWAGGAYFNMWYVDVFQVRYRTHWKSCNILLTQFSPARDWFHVFHACNSYEIELMVCEHRYKHRDWEVNNYKNLHLPMIMVVQSR
jgi:hypothetical protein